MPQLINSDSSISWRRAHEFGRMLACHIHHGRFDFAKNVIDWAKRESQETPEPITTRSPLAALRLPIWLADKLNELDIVYIGQLGRTNPVEIRAWRSKTGRRTGPRAFKILCEKLSQHGITIW